MHHRISLTRAERRELHDIIRKGTHKSREISRAEILLLSYEGKEESAIAERVRKSTRTVKRVCGRFAEGGIQRAVFDAPRSGQPRKTTAKDDAHLIATACTGSPEGTEHWTLELLQKQFKKDRGKRLGTTAIWLRLRANDLKPWREKNVVHSESHPGIR